MQRGMGRVLALLALSAWLAAAAEVTPVQKVVELMEGMLAKGKAEKHKEQVQFATYSQFCKDTIASKGKAIAKAETTVEKLTADIEKFGADAADLSKQIGKHDEDVAVWKGDTRSATKVREIEKADYDALHKDYSESIDALERAIAVLKEQAVDRKQVSLAQLQAVSKLQRVKLLPDEARKAIAAFIEQEPSDPLSVVAPEADAYEFQSSGIVDMLGKLLGQFQGERSKLEREEMNSAHAFEMLMQDLKAQIEAASEDAETKRAEKAALQESKATAKGALVDTEKLLEEDKVYLSDLATTCSKKASDFEARQQLRTEEIVAVEKAIDIISSNAVSGSAKKHLPALAQQKRPQHRSLAMLRADMESSAAARAASYLQARAGALGSRSLAALAERMGQDEFKKVKKMIKDLIIRLMEEAKDEVEHKGWCDAELATNEQTRREKTEAVEMLHADVDELEASIAKGAEDLAALTKAISELETAMAEATKLREAERAKNEETVTDAQEAQTAVAQAVTVLKEFYEKAGEATALVQQQPEAPEIFDTPYRGMQAENGGVVGMLEIIQSDFARLEADTKASEASAVKEYEEFMSDSKVDKSSKASEMEVKTRKKEHESQALVQKKRDLEGTQKELDAALAYFDKLKPSCVDSGVNYEDRVARRKAEIDSLQEALRILRGQDIA